MMRKRPPAGSQQLFPAPAQRAPEHFLVAHIDGGARGNPGPAGFGVVLADQEGKKLTELSEFLGVQTNNVAEYAGLVAALESALARGARALKVVSDSELLVRQIEGRYKVRAPALKEWHARARALIERLDWFRIEHVSRARNRAADRLANRAMDRGTP